MPLTRPIPDEAMPVVEVLRRDVPRPETLPSFPEDPEDCRSLRWRTGRSPTCPMGFHPDAALPLPPDDTCFPVKDTDFVDHVGEFGEWWDEQTDAQAAVDAVWGEG